MLTTLLFLAHVAVIAAIAVALVRPSWRAGTAAGLLVVGVVAAAAALLTGGSGLRTLELSHTFASYENAEIRLKAFPVDRVQAPAFAWGLGVLVFCLGWAAWLRANRVADDDPEGRELGVGVHGFWGPMILAWSALVFGVALQKLAAPAGLVEPLAVDRAILPAAIAACFLLAHQLRKVVLVLAWLSVFVTFARVPVVVFGTLATQREWGTSFDVHTITLFANPLAQMPVEVAAHSSEQLGWLIWAPHLLVMPALYMLSLGGIGFAITMFLLHPKTDVPPRTA